MEVEVEQGKVGVVDSVRVEHDPEYRVNDVGIKAAEQSARVSFPKNCDFDRLTNRDCSESSLRQCLYHCGAETTILDQQKQYTREDVLFKRPVNVKYIVDKGVDM